MTLTTTLYPAKTCKTKTFSSAYPRTLSACILACSLLLNGCATGIGIKTANKTNNTPKAIESRLTAEFVYKYLVAEIAGQRGDLATSGSIFMT